ncbi:fluoride efflux transporter CrcB [Arthrobacter sp. H14-L1]|uniref:fluoride efflux transporter CrcB n=1 Tax=Arthrobacter sp. H14-L1 TaxID=2996697 RepID=UPI00226D51A0|nr:fluoride efflux transporter CrcB [Arthrobacter sp. H14-L1]MCY0905191.1 fluoride efflux transporter CrcB [Arthrobacter sp. H14-L1]
MTVLLLALAGGVGAGTRFLLDGLIRSWFRTSLPLGTIAINLTGSLALGFVAGLVLTQHVGSDFQLVTGTGFLGGYTTFSTASFETVRLIQAGRTWYAVINGLGTMVLAVAAAGAGVALADLL